MTYRHFILLVGLVAGLAVMIIHGALEYAKVGQKVTDPGAESRKEIPLTALTDEKGSLAVDTYFIDEPEPLMICHFMLMNGGAQLRADCSAAESVQAEIEEIETRLRSCLRGGDL